MHHTFVSKLYSVKNLFCCCKHEFQLLIQFFDPYHRNSIISSRPIFYLSNEFKAIILINLFLTYEKHLSDLAQLNKISNKTPLLVAGYTFNVNLYGR